MFCDEHKTTTDQIYSKNNCLPKNSKLPILKFSLFLVLSGFKTLFVGIIKFET